jgi:signal transduction histidine kinase
MEKTWQAVWSQAGRVPLRQKIIGIVVTSLLILGVSIAWWVRNSLGGWLSYLLSEERVAQAMSVGSRGVFIITLLAMMVGLVVAWMLTWVLTRPILHITRVAQEVERGDLTVRAPIWANDEVGALGQAFNAMIDSLANSHAEMETVNEQLRRRNEELAILYELAGLACQTTDAHEVLRQGLHRALDVTGGQAGFVVLQDKSQAWMQIATAHNIPSSALPEFAHQKADDRGLFLEVAHSGAMYRVPDVRQQKGLPEEFVAYTTQQGLYQMTITPIQGKTRAAGVMVLLSDRDSTAWHNEESVLNAMCNQLGMSLDNAELWEELRRKEAVRTRLLAKIVSAQEEERQRISRELHDETGQALTSLLVQLKVLARLSTVDAMREHAGTLRELVSQALDEVRRLSLDLRPSTLDDLGLIPALEWYIKERVRPRGLDVTFEGVDLSYLALPRESEVVLYRVVQEAFTNIWRHAEASYVRVTVAADEDELSLVIEDDGCGFEVEETLNSQERGLGLLGMRERVELAGGQLLIASAPGEGTRIEVLLSASKGG